MPLFSAVAPLPVNRIKNRLFDPDARDYILRVEAADGERLESQVRGAINSFVIGCKADGIWTSLVASCIMAGARTVAGAITPLVGNAPTNNNFVVGDYSRKLGLLGNNSNKYLATGYNNNDTTNFPQNNAHISCYVSASQTNASGVFVGTGAGIGSKLFLNHNTTTTIIARNRALTTSGSLAQAPLGFQGNSRNNSANFDCRLTSSSGVTSSTVTAASTTPTNELIGVFASGNGTAFTSARMSFYSIGKSLTLSSLDSRVTTLMNTLASVIA
jgi:hypothetical protein